MCFSLWNDRCFNKLASLTNDCKHLWHVLVSGFAKVPWYFLRWSICASSLFSIVLEQKGQFIHMKSILENWNFRHFVFMFWIKMNVNWVNWLFENNKWGQVLSRCSLAQYFFEKTLATYAIFCVLSSPTQPKFRRYEKSISATSRELGELWLLSTTEQSLKFQKYESRRYVKAGKWQCYWSPCSHQLVVIQ